MQRTPEGDLFNLVECIFQRVIIKWLAVNRINRHYPVIFSSPRKKEVLINSINIIFSGSLA